MKKEKKGKKGKKYIGILGLMVVICLSLSFVLDESNRIWDGEQNEQTGQQEQNEQSEPSEEEITSDTKEVYIDEICIADIGVFSGSYVEDGTDEKVDSVAALTVENRGEKWVEYMEIEVENGGDIYHFSVSALPAYSTVIVLEQDRKETWNSKEYNVSAKNIAYYSEEPSLHEELFKVTAENKQITVKNISKKDISGTIYVYYKSKVDDVYIGGIAYRTKVEAGLKAGENQSIYAGHYNKDTSEVLFITYVE